jgi:protein MpaA
MNSPPFPSDGSVVSRLLRPLDELQRTHSDYLYKREGDSNHLPSYLFFGPRGGGDFIRLALFGGIHGDEPESVSGLVRFVEDLVKTPEEARDFALTLYPVCNPTGLQNRSRHSVSGKDLNREFWRDSIEPEVRFLEQEIERGNFQGLINLHCDDTSEGLYGFVHGEVLSENLLEPALAAGETFLPRDRRLVIDGFPARNGVITDCYSGVLQTPPRHLSRPFVLTLETPQREARELQEQAFSSMLRGILAAYRSILALGANL